MTTTTMSVPGPHPDPPRPRRATALDNPVHLLRVCVVARMHRNGAGVGELAKALDVSRQTVYNWLDQAPDALDFLVDDQIQMYVVWRLRRKGSSIDDLARAFGVSRRAICAWLAEAPDALDLIDADGPGPEPADPAAGLEILRA